MVSTYYSERDRRFIFCGRLALALAGRRGENCRNRRCARQRHCLALATDGSRETSPCPVMTSAEWGAVRTAVGRIGESLRPWFKAEDAREEALFAGLPKAKRQKAMEEFRAEVKRYQAARPRWVPYCFDFLWTEPLDDRLQVPPDIAAEEKKLVAAAIAIGCLCAREGTMAVDCARCEGR